MTAKHSRKIPTKVKVISKLTKNKLAIKGIIRIPTNLNLTEQRILENFIKSTKTYFKKKKKKKLNKLSKNIFMKILEHDSVLKKKKKETTGREIWQIKEYLDK